MATGSYALVGELYEGAALISVYGGTPANGGVYTVIPYGGVTLVVPAGKTLTVSGTLTGSAGPAASLIEVAGTLTGADNFYDGNNDLIIGDIPHGTYGWSGDADGQGTGGWAAS